jgi:glycosyltransferase involved in cell wall biosynthesis
MPRVLIVAYYFPPLGGIGSIRVASFAQHLPEFGWEPTVLAPRDGAYFRDPELAFAEDHIIRTPSIEFSRAGKRLLRAGGSDVAPAKVGGLRAGLRSVARSVIYFPDPQAGWYPPAMVTAARRLRGRSFDAVFSSSFPITAHLIARRIARRLKLPWVAEYRDPWSQTLPPGSILRRRALLLERSLATEASALVMTSPSWATMHSRRWNRPVDVIPNGHDGQAPTRARSDHRFTLTYLGSHYPAIQRLDAVWEAVRQINEGPNPHVERLRFIGELHHDVDRKLHENKLEALVEVTGFLPHREALARLDDASVLIMAGPSDATGLMPSGVIGAKVFEYLATGLPIVYVGDPCCDTGDLLRDYAGCHVLATDDVRGIKAALQASRGQRFQRDLRSSTRKARTSELADILSRA